MKKRFGALVLVLALAAALFPAAAMAAPIVYETEGSITIHKFDNTGTHTPTQNPDGQLITDTTLFGNPLSEIPFKVTQLPATIGSPAEPINLSTLTTTEAKAIIALEDYTTNGLFQDEGATNASGVLSFGNLPLGAYLVEEQPSPAISKVIQPFLVYLPLTYIDADGDQNLLYDVHVYPKNQPLFITKTVNGTNTDFNVGDTVAWNIDFGIPADINEINLSDEGHFYILDDLDERLDYTSTAVHFMETNSSGELVIAETLTADTDYTLTAPTVGDSDIVKVDFTTQAMIDDLKVAVDAGYQVRAVITTTINDKAAIDLSQGITNNASLHYKKDSGDTTPPIEPPGPEIKMTGLSVYKTAADSGQPLAGALFELEWRATSGDTWANVGSATTDTDGLIYWSFDVSQSGGASGNVVGLGEFRVKETAVPAGYQLMNGYSEMIELDDSTIPPKLSGTWKIANIKLNPGGGGFILPSTGGDGMLLYILAGFILILLGGSVVFGIAKSKKNRRNSTGNK